MDFTGKTALITGGASGMGLLCSRCFVEAGGSGTDKRIKIVRITSAGGACLAEAQVHAEDSEAHLLSALTEEEQSLFNCLLKKVSESL